MTNSLVEFLTAQFNREAAEARYARDRNAELPLQLRSAGERVKDMYGDPEPPEDEVNPADRMWWLAKDAADWIEQHGPERVLADIEAKRRILYLAEQLPKVTASTDMFDNHRDAWAEVLKQLALPYADHPDYRPEWRP
ncbi:DUF6221 family protein [Streptomyces werraensis]|nr:DUF6221 family protein [Streptomyces werraensis]